MQNFLDNLTFIHLPSAEGITILRRSPSHMFVIARSMPAITSLLPSLKINGVLRE